MRINLKNNKTNQSVNVLYDSPCLRLNVFRHEHRVIQVERRRLELLWVCVCTRVTRAVWVCHRDRDKLKNSRMNRFSEHSLARGLGPKETLGMCKTKIFRPEDY